MAQSTGGAEDQLDPRVRRTRKMLQDALAKLLKEKDFDKISIGDIAEEATLNRATFYSHYTDKFALLECLVAGQFQALIAKRKIRFDGCEGALKNISVGVCYYLSENMRAGDEGLRQASAPLETAIVAVVRRLVMEGFAAHPPQGKVPLEILSSVIAWSIYGAAREWARGSRRMPANRLGEMVEGLVKGMLSSGE